MADGLTLTGLISIGSQGAMIFGGIVPFIPQYLDIWKSRNADGFSTFVCLTLLIANILRILFWFGRHFELPLLAQSILMIMTMMVLIHLCVSVKNKNEIITSKPRTLSESKEERRFMDLNPLHFWRWTDFLSYVEFTLAFAFTMSVLTFLCLESVVYVEALGFAAVFVEAMLGAPQFHRNLQNKSTLGMSKKMVMFWTCGDVFKTCYFVLREAPAQFWICGVLQVCIDLAIFGQVFYYNVFPNIKDATKKALS